MTASSCAVDRFNVLYMWQEQNQAVQNAVNLANSRGFEVSSLWIGGSDYKKQDTWMWEDLVPMSVCLVASNLRQCCMLLWYSLSRADGPSHGVDSHLCGAGRTT